MVWGSECQIAAKVWGQRSEIGARSSVESGQNPCQEVFVSKIGFGLHLGESSRMKNQAKEEVVGRISRRHPGVIRADIPAQNFGQGAQNPQKKQAFGRGYPWLEGADVQDPNQRRKIHPKKSTQNKKVHLNKFSEQFLLGF